MRKEENLHIEMINVGVIGYGYWGPNIVRNFNNIERAKVTAICDKDEAALSRARKSYPNIHTTNDYNEVLSSPDIDADCSDNPGIDTF